MPTEMGPNVSEMWSARKRLRKDGNMAGAWCFCSGACVCCWRYVISKLVPCRRIDAKNELEMGRPVQCRITFAPAWDASVNSAKAENIGKSSVSALSPSFLPWISDAILQFKRHFLGKAHAILDSVSDILTLNCLVKVIAYSDSVPPLSLPQTRSSWNPVFILRKFNPRKQELACPTRSARPCSRGSHPGPRPSST